MNNIKKEEKWLENKLALIQASITGHCIGVNLANKRLQSFDYNYETGVSMRKIIQRDIMKIYNHAYKKGVEYGRNENI